jgi:hypothetical protein
MAAAVPHPASRTADRVREGARDGELKWTAYMVGGERLRRQLEEMRCSDKIRTRFGAARGQRSGATRRRNPGSSAMGDRGSPVALAAQRRIDPSRRTEHLRRRGGMYRACPCPALGCLVVRLWSTRKPAIALLLFIFSNLCYFDCTTINNDGT